MGTNVIAFDLTGKIFHDNNPDFWIMVLELAFGSGVALGPLLVMFFELHVYKVVAIVTILMTPLVFKNPLPNMEEGHDD